MSFKKTCYSVFAGLAIVSASQAEIRDTQDKLISWVETKKTISETEANWLAEKEIITDLVKVLENEKTKLEESIEKLDTSADATDKLRTDLNADKESLLAANETLESVIPELEAKARDLLAKLPKPLIEELDPLIRRLPEAGKKSSLPVSQRLLTVVGILNKVDKFNTGITITSEIRNLGETSMEVKTIYFGLAGAFFASDNGAYTGIGIPAEGGWKWEEDKAIAGSVVDLIDTYEGAREASFVTLPVQTL
ncbi:DUF3450 family protein [Coraliomargarita parva]|uniref:DUF3450 family protein n=1 Tax=Coraliomargarita parva TaxID=3014050 RepID=UPI0022B2EAEA|nr:DUF3450 family protein [Coraliomargarita parva]